MGSTKVSHEEKRARNEHDKLMGCMALIVDDLN